MNLKYYLRGLGIGITVTALIMGIATGGSKETLSNEEIKERAKELGMIEESTVLGDVLPTQAPTQEPVVESTPTQEPEEQPTEAPTPTAEPEATPTSMPTEKPAPTEKPTDSETAESVKVEKSVETDDVESSSEDGSESYTVEVKSGQDSYTVCEKLEEIGLIASASDFDRYLYQSGYDKKIRAGKHEIPADADTEEIAQILAGLK